MSHGFRLGPKARPSPATAARAAPPRGLIAAGRSAFHPGQFIYAVLSDSERPPSILRIRFGSPNAFMPDVVGLRPVRPRNALTRELNCRSSVSMPVTVKTRLRGRQLAANVRNAS